MSRSLKLLSLVLSSIVVVGACSAGATATATPTVAPTGTPAATRTEANRSV